MSSLSFLPTRRAFLRSAARFGASAAFLPQALCQDGTARAVGTEAEKGDRSEAIYLPEWAGPSESSQPSWARAGRIRFARWDGGALEAAKATLSGWPQFSPPNPDYVRTMKRWYDLDTVQLLRDASINLIWVTFSVGFSNETEQPQQNTLRAYIAECHRHGIRVMAYESLANIFFEDMFASVRGADHWVSRDNAGVPIPYGAADYKKVGRVTRYLANLHNSAWMAYVQTRVELAMRAGADGIMFDNCMGPGLLQSFRDILQFAYKRDAGFLVMANFHREQFVYNRLLNAITTEEGAESGIFSAAKLAATNNRLQKERASMVQVDESYLANNIGRLRVFRNLGEGWKPTMMECRTREEAGMAESRIMTPQRLHLVMAENMMFNSAFEPSVEIELAHGLLNKTREATQAWQAIGQYNRFASLHEDLYVGARSVAPVAVILDNHSDGLAMLNGLAGRNVQFDVLYEQQLSSALLKNYQAVALLNAPMVRHPARAALEAYVEAGGHLYVAGDSMSRDEAGRPETQPDWITRHTSEYWPTLPSADEIAAKLVVFGMIPWLRVNLPRSVLYTVASQLEKRRMIVHLINYAAQRSGVCSFTLSTKRTARLISPDTADPRLHIEQEGGSTRIRVESVQTYSVLVLTHS